MGLQDRDTMRRDPPPARALRASRGWRPFLWGTVGLVALAFAGIYLAREIRADSAPAEGNLIVNINTATQEQLQTIPGVGAILAKRIIGKRPFKRVEDLRRVNGIDDDTLNNIRPYVKVEGETEER